MQISELMQFDGMIFDLDGTLIDSGHVWHEIDRIFLSRRGFEIPKDYAKTVSTMNFIDAAVYTKELFSLDETPEEMIAEWAELAIMEYTNNIKALPHAAEFLAMLCREGKRIALATASNEKLYTAVLKSNGIYDCFDCFASTEQVARGKGFPDVYELAAEELGLTPDRCIVFEDIIEGIRGAKLGGFAAAACLYRVFQSDAETMRKEADIAFTDYSELLTLC